MNSDLKDVLHESPANFTQAPLSIVSKPLHHLHAQDRKNHFFRLF